MASSDKKVKLWGSRFKGTTSDLLIDFTESVSFDTRLALYDIQGSLAHAAMLKKIGVLTASEFKEISRNLKIIETKVKSGSFRFRTDLEDVHMNIEHELIRMMGPSGGKLHTGRSRNDQIALDTKLYLKDVLSEIIKGLKTLVSVLTDFAEKNSSQILPGYTHLQQAQPVSAGHYFTAWAFKFKRDTENYAETMRQTDVLPLGVGAMAGVNYPSDRVFLAEKLGFSRISEHSMDTVSDRDYQAHFLFSSSLFQIHMSRLCEDLIIYNSNEFGFVDLPDEFTTGSSIMPNKKNPDILELVRGKSGRVLGNLNALLINLKGLPLTYNRDLQEDKPGLFDSADTVLSVLKIMTALLKRLTLNENNIDKALQAGFMLATDIADHLVECGIPFRQAHGVAGRIVRYCTDQNRRFQDLSLKEWQGFHKELTPDFIKSLTYERSLSRKTSPGGTGPVSVKRNISLLKKWIKK